MNVIVSLVLMAVTVAGGSIAWPRLTTQPRPEPLERVADAVMMTRVGQSFANVLGITNEMNQPINVASEASTIATGIVTAARERMAMILVTQAVRQLVGQIDTLPAKEKEQIIELLCKPQQAQ